MREPALRFETPDRFSHFLSLAGVWATTVAEYHLDSPLHSEVKESESVDEWEHLWLELGGEG
jgi:hypothetical protein